MMQLVVMLLIWMELVMVFQQHQEQVLLLVDRIYSLFSVMQEFFQVNNVKLIDVIIMLVKVVDNLISTEVVLVNIVFMILQIMLVQLLVILLKLDGQMMVTIFLEESLVHLCKGVMLLQMIVEDILMELMDIIIMNKLLNGQQKNLLLKVVLQVK